MNRWRMAVIAVIVLGLGGALLWSQVLGNENGPDPVATDETSPTPEPSPETTPPEEEVEAPDLVGEDYTQIVADILGFLDALSEEPDPSRLDQVYDPRCPCYEERRKSLAELRKRGYRYVDPHTEVLSVERSASAGSRDRVVLEVVAREGATIVVDSAGEVVDEFEAKPPTKFTFVLVRKGAEEPWRVSTLVRVGPVGEEG